MIANALRHAFDVAPVAAGYAMGAFVALALLVVSLMIWEKVLDRRMKREIRREEELCAQRIEAIADEIKVKADQALAEAYEWLRIEDEGL